MKFRDLAKRLLPVWVLLVAGLIAFVLVKAGPKVEEEKAEIPPFTVKVAAASFEEVDWQVAFQAEVRAKTTIKLVAQVLGTVTAVSEQMTEGGEFTIGERLIQIDQTDYQLALESARAQIAQARTSLAVEQGTAEIRKQQWESLGRKTKPKPLQMNQPQVQQAEAALAAAKAQLAKAQLDLSRTEIAAPFAGRVMRKLVDVGEFVSIGTPLGEIFSTDQVELRLPMTDQQLQSLGLKMGFQANAEQAPVAKISYQSGITAGDWTGKLMRVDSMLDPNTRLIYGTVVVEQPFAQSNAMPLAPGLFVDVTLPAIARSEGVRIPRLALRRGNQVYTVEEGKLAIKQVKVLQTSPQDAIVSEGLSAGAQVVISPVPGAFEGMGVEIASG